MRPTFPRGTDNMPTIEAMTAERDQLDARLKTLADTGRPEDQPEFDRLLGERTALNDTIERHQSIRRSAERGHVEHSQGPTVIRKAYGGNPWDGPAAGPAEIHDRAKAAMDCGTHLPHHVRQTVTELVEREEPFTFGPSVARWALETSAPAYERAFASFLRNPERGHLEWSEDERIAWANVQTVMRSMSTTNASAILPTALDPAVILTNSGTGEVGAVGNIIRTEVTATSPWAGVTSSGSTFSWDTEGAEVSDDSPTLVSKTVPLYPARGFIAATFEQVYSAGDGFANEITKILTDGMSNLVETAMVTGSGSSQPTGIFTALDAIGGAQELVSTTAAQIGVEDLDAVYEALSPRFRNRAVWVMAPKWLNAIRNLGTAVSNSFTVDLSAGVPQSLYGRPVIVSGDAPTTTTTTALDQRLVFFDPTQYLRALGVGSGVEFISNLFGTSAGRPTGHRGWFMHARVGGDLLISQSGILLMDKTSA